MGKKPNDSLAEIDAAVACAANERRETWFDRLPPEAREVMGAAKEKYLAGGYAQVRRHSLAKILREWAQERGLQTCDAKRLAEWLAKK